MSQHPLELEEKWFVKGTAILAEHRHFSVVISNHVVLVEDSHFHNVEILGVRLVEVSKSIWLLGNGVPTVMVS